MSDVVDPQRLIFPGLAGLYRSFAPYGYAFMRFSAGAVLVPHGVQKVFFGSVERLAQSIAAQGLPFPTLLATLTFGTELLGGACLALGLLTRIAAAAVFVQMAVIITVFQWQYGYFWTNKGFEYPLLWLLLSLAIFFRGGGTYSIDRLIGREF